MHYDDTGGNIVLKFPPWGQIGPATKDLLDLHKFQKTGGEFSNHYRRGYFTEAERKLLTQAALHIKSLYNTGQREYCRELLVSKPRIKHG